MIQYPKGKNRWKWKAPENNNVMKNKNVQILTLGTFSLCSTHVLKWRTPFSEVEWVKNFSFCKLSHAHMYSVSALIMDSWGYYTKVGFLTSLSGTSCYEVWETVRTGGTASKTIDCLWILRV